MRIAGAKLKASGAGGLDIIQSGGPVTREDKQPAKERVQFVLRFARSLYQWIVVDLGRLSPFSLRLAEEAGSLYVVSTCDILGLNEAKSAVGSAAPVPASIAIGWPSLSTPPPLSPAFPGKSWRSSWGCASSRCCRSATRILRRVSWTGSGWEKAASSKNIWRSGRQKSPAYRGMCRPGKAESPFCGSVSQCKSRNLIPARMASLDALPPDFPPTGPGPPALETFLSMFPSPMAVWDFDGRIRRSNSLFDRLMGSSFAEREGRSIFDFAHPDDLAAAVAAFRKLLVVGKITGFECRTRCNDGSYRWLVLNAAAVPSEKLIYVSAHDITKRKRGRRGFAG